MVAKTIKRFLAAALLVLGVAGVAYAGSAGSVTKAAGEITYGKAEISLNGNSVVITEEGMFLDANMDGVADSDTPLYSDDMSNMGIVGWSNTSTAYSGNIMITIDGGTVGSVSGATGTSTSYATVNGTVTVNLKSGVVQTICGASYSNVTKVVIDITGGYIGQGSSASSDIKGGYSSNIGNLVFNFAGSASSKDTSSYTGEMAFIENGTVTGDITATFGTSAGNLTYTCFYGVYDGTVKGDVNVTVDSGSWAPRKNAMVYNDGVIEGDLTININGGYYTSSYSSGEYSSLVSGTGATICGDTTVNIGDEATGHIYIVYNRGTVGNVFIDKPNASFTFDTAKYNSSTFTQTEGTGYFFNNKGVVTVSGEYVLKKDMNVTSVTLSTNASLTLDEGVTLTTTGNLSGPTSSSNFNSVKLCEGATMEIGGSFVVYYSDITLEKNTTINVAGYLDHEYDGEITVAKDAEITAGSYIRFGYYSGGTATVVNAGTIKAGTYFSVRYYSSITNTGTIEATTNFEVDKSVLENSGSIVVGTTLSASGDTFANSGTMDVTGEITVRSTDATNSGTITCGDKVTFSTSLTNDGTITSEGVFYSGSSYTIVNNGTIKSNSTGTSYTHLYATIENNGTFYATNKYYFYDFTNGEKATVTLDNDAEFKSGYTLVNNGTITGNGTLTVASSTTNNGTITGNSTFTVSGTNTNNGTYYGSEDSTFTVSGTTTNNGTIKADGSLVTSGAVTNYGDIKAAASYKISGILYNYGTVTAASEETSGCYVAKTVYNYQDASFSAVGMYLYYANIYNYGDFAVTGENFSVTGSSSSYRIYTTTSINMPLAKTSSTVIERVYYAVTANYDARYFTEESPITFTATNGTTLDDTYYARGDSTVYMTVSTDFVNDNIGIASVTYTDTSGNEVEATYASSKYLTLAYYNPVCFTITLEYTGEDLSPVALDTTSASYFLMTGEEYTASSPLYCISTDAGVSGDNEIEDISQVYSITSGALPTGLELDSETGAIYGTTTAAGSFEAVITLRGANLTTVDFTLTVVVEATHAYNSGVITTAATTSSTGVKTYTCTVCGATKTETIPKLTETTTESSTTSTTGTSGSTSSDSAASTTTATSAAVGTVLTDSTGSSYKVTSSGDDAAVTLTTAGSGLTGKVTIDTVTIGGVTYKVTAIDDGAFKGNKAITEIVIGNSVKTIGASAFESCTKLKTVTIGTGLVSIAKKAFFKCTALTNVTVNSTVLESIGASAFEKCTKLKSFKSVSTVLKNIGKKCFNGDKKLKKVTLKTTKLTKKSVKKDAFKGIAKKCTFKVPKKKIKAYKALFVSRGAKKTIKVKK